MIRLEAIGYRYPTAAAQALEHVDLVVEPGLAIVSGRSGSGKSTLLRLLNGLVPHFHGGQIAGRAIVAGRDVIGSATRDLARDVGFVFQDPERSFVYGTVEREIAFSLENLGIDPARIQDRVDEALCRLGIAALRTRRIATLSGGERQRVAIAAAIVTRPAVLALDEPTSQLDPGGAASVVDACLALRQEGLTVAVAEHRLDRLLPVSDRVLVVDGGRVTGMDPASAAPALASPPAVVELGLALGWRPLPLSVADARRPARDLDFAPPPDPPRPSDPVAWSITGGTLGPGGTPILDNVDLTGSSGQVVVLVGPNGGGKTTILRTLAGLIRPLAGRVDRRPGRAAYVPQDPGSLLHRATVRDEIAVTIARTRGRDDGERLLGDLGLTGLVDRYPRDLSAGERQRAAVAAVLAGGPDLALLDEPTRGMDRAARDAIGQVIGRLRAGGAAVVVATHDLDLAAEVGDTIVRVADGRVVELGPPARALSGSGSYATQIGALLPGGPVTVRAVVDGIARRAP